MTLQGLNLPEWLQTALGITNEMIIPLFTTIVSVLILITTAIVRRRLNDKISEYKQLIDILKNIDDKDATGEVKQLQTKIDDMNKGFITVVSALELVFTNSNLPAETRDKLLTIFSHAKTNDYEALLEEAKQEAAKLKDQVAELTNQLNGTANNKTTEETNVVVNTERA